MAATGEASKHRAGLGLVTRLSETQSLEHDLGIRSDHPSTRRSPRDRAGLLHSQPEHVIFGRLGVALPLVDGGRTHLEIRDKNGQQFAAARRSRRQYKRPAVAAGVFLARFSHVDTQSLTMIGMP